MLQFSEKLLNNLMQIGLTVSLAALVPLILRRLMKKRYPARMVCVVWAILALRLLIPVQLTLPQAPVQVMPRTSYVVQSDQTAFRQAGLPVGQNPTRWVTARRRKRSARQTPGHGQDRGYYRYSADAVAGRRGCLRTLAGAWLLPADTQPERYVSTGRTRGSAHDFAGAVRRPGY